MSAGLLLCNVLALTSQQTNFNQAVKSCIKLSDLTTILNPYISLCLNHYFIQIEADQLRRRVTSI